MATRRPRASGKSPAPTQRNTPDEPPLPLRARRRRRLHRLGELLLEWNAGRLLEGAHPLAYPQHSDRGLTHMPPIAREVQLKPLGKKILLHLRKRNSISPLEAFSTYGTMRLAAQIHDLRE